LVKGKNIFLILKGPDLNWLVTWRSSVLPLPLQ
jgi:hypothetical protein